MIIYVCKTLDRHEICRLYPDLFVVDSDVVEAATGLDEEYLSGFESKWIDLQSNFPKLQKEFFPSRNLVTSSAILIGQADIVIFSHRSNLNIPELKLLSSEATMYQINNSLINIYDMIDCDVTSMTQVELSLHMCLHELSYISTNVTNVAKVSVVG